MQKEVRARRTLTSRRKVFSLLTIMHECGGECVNAEMAAEKKNQFHYTSFEIYYLRQLTLARRQKRNNLQMKHVQKCEPIFCDRFFFRFRFSFLRARSLSTPPVLLSPSLPLYRSRSCAPPTPSLNYSFYNNIHSIHFHLCSAQFSTISSVVCSLSSFNFIYIGRETTTTKPKKHA